jgi:hypothetical protein
MRVQASLDHHGEAVHDTTAFDAKRRRKANRQQRRTAALPLDLSAMQKRAEHDVRLRCNLSEAAMAGVPGAAKAKRRLNDVWTNRNQRSLGDFWRPV